MDGKKLVIVMGSMGRGGAERVISHISEHFARKGWQVWIALLLSNTVEYMLHENVQIVDLSGSTQSRLKRLPHWILGLRKLVKQVQPDTVLAFAARINIIAQIACSGIHTRIVVSERNDPFSDGRSGNVDLLTNWLYPKADVVVFQTKRAASYFKKLGLENTCIIPNPIAVQYTAGQSIPGKIVTVGRLTAQKNQKMLLGAFGKVLQNFPDAQLHLFGEGELRQTLARQAAALGIADRVFLRGNLPDVHRQISDASLFVLPSDYEGLSNALLEAMMMGLPCISTDCAGSDEYIESGKNGLLVPVGGKDELAEAICTLLAEPERAALLGKAATKSVSALEKSVIMEQWDAVLS